MIIAPATGEVGTSTVFRSDLVASPGLSIAWSFGDGRRSTDASPTHSYLKGGDYEVRLTVSNTAGSLKEATAKISVNNRNVVRGLTCSKPDSGGWCWVYPRPTGNARNDYFFLNPSLGWSVGDQGEMYKTTDGGANWISLNSGVKTPLLQIRFADPLRGWALDSRGGLLRSVDGGLSWTTQLSSAHAEADRIRLIVVNGQTAIASTPDGYQYTADGGASWTKRQPRLNFVEPDGTLWFFTGGTLSKSSDGGATRKTLLSGIKTEDDPYTSFRTLFRVSNKQLLVVAETRSSFDTPSLRWIRKGLIRRSTNGGASWETFEVSGQEAVGLDGFIPIDANTAYAHIGQERYRSVDGWRTWTRSFLQGRGSGHANPIQPEYALEDGVVYHPNAISRDNGETWQQTGWSPSDEHMYQPIGAQTWLSKYHGGGGAALLVAKPFKRTDVSGVDGPPLERLIRKVWFFEAGRQLATNQSGELMESLDSGRSWAVIGTNFDSIGDRQFLSDTTGWMVNSDVIYRTNDGGRSWSASPLSNVNFRTVHFVDEFNGFAYAGDFRDPTEQPDGGYRANGVGVLMASTDGGKTWNRRTRVNTINGGSYLNVGGIYDMKFSSAKKGVALISGSVKTTNDGGLTWTDRNPNADFWASSLVQTKAGVLWAVGRKLWRSNDDGATWEQQAIDLAPDNFSQLRFADAQNGWIVGNKGRIYRTKDGGNTWTQQDSGTGEDLVDAYFSDTRTGWIVTRGGAIMATGTGGN